MAAHITARVGFDDRLGYQTVVICAGPEGDTHVMVGRLTMKEAEAAELVARIQAKAHPHTEECALLAAKLRVEKKASAKARSNAERAHSKAAMYRRKLEAVRAELHELQGQFAQLQEVTQ